MLWSTILLSMLLLSISMAAPQLSQSGRDKLKEAATGMMRECKEKAGATDEDLKSVRDKKMPTTRTGQCMLECFLEKAKFMKNGKLDKIGAVETATLAARGDMSKIGKFRELLDVCDGDIKKAKETDKCKIAKRVIECATKRGKEFGFDITKQM